MKVICSGMSKTGTKTLCEALRILGYQVNDFEEQYFYQTEDWFKFLESGDLSILKKMYENVDAITDTPACVFWEELLNLFPDAKVRTLRLSARSRFYISRNNRFNSRGRGHEQGNH